jgi:hypothetical protein
MRYMDTEGGIGGGPSWETPAWAVRIRRGDGTVAGAGVLISPEWVLTCTCAVAGGELVTAEFVGVPGRPQAGVAACTRGTAGAGGVALLRLVRPGPAGAASPLHRRSVPRRDVRIYGFPAADGDGDGAWLRATTAADGGGPDGRVRLASGEPVPPGFGGAGVADADTGELLGMALAAPDPGTDPRAYMSPAESIVRQLPQATAWTRGRVAVDERLRAGRPGGGPAAPALLDPSFATRLADWFRGGSGRRGGDGRQVKISLVRTEDPVRGAVLSRAVTLADRELRPGAPALSGDPGRGGPAQGAPRTPPGEPPDGWEPPAHPDQLEPPDHLGHPNRPDPAGRPDRAGPPLTPPDEPGPPGPPLRPRPPAAAIPYSTDPPETVPPPGSLDLALDATGRSARWIAERVADRMGLGPSRGLPAAERVRAARVTLTLVVVGVDEATDPDRLLGLLALLMAHGDRMLLVFRTSGEHFARAQSQLVIEPGQQRQARLAEQLAEVTGLLARALHEKAALVRADISRALDALVRAYAVQAELAGTNGIVAGLGQDPALARYERVAGWAAARLRQTVARLDELLDRRAELLGRLTAYHALYQGGSDREDLEAEGLYLAGYERLHAKPCDVAAAEPDVRRYIDFIERGGRRRAREGGDPPR